MSLDIGQVLEGKYRVVRLIGEGGMGAVFEGENLRLRRRVAIKVLHRRAANNEETIQRFEREAQTAGQIGSDHILEVIDFGALPGGERFMIMEFLDGEPLSARIAKTGRIDPRALVPLLLQVLTGLDAAHAAGIVHRDLKPDNIFILRGKGGVRDFVKLIDFGISKVQNTTGDALTLTKTGAVMGTPYYLSPEQANGSHDADARSDIYSLGVIAYEAITGRVPFHARSFTELLFKIVLADPIPPQQIVPDLDLAFCSIVMKAIARDPSARFQSATEFAEALELWLKQGRGVTIPDARAALYSEDFDSEAPTSAMAFNPGPPVERSGSQPEVIYDSSPAEPALPAPASTPEPLASRPSGRGRRESGSSKTFGIVSLRRLALIGGLILLAITALVLMLLKLPGRWLPWSGKPDSPSTPSSQGASSAPASAREPVGSAAARALPGSGSAPTHRGAYIVIEPTIDPTPAAHVSPGDVSSSGMRSRGVSPRTPSPASGPSARRLPSAVPPSPEGPGPAEDPHRQDYDLGY